MPKRKAEHKTGSKRPTKQTRLVSSSEEEQYASDCSSCDHDRLFEQEQQSLARTAVNRRRKAARNRQTLRNRSHSASSRRRGTRGRERRNDVKYPRNKPRCTPRRPANNRRRRERNAPRTTRRGGTRRREHRTAVPYTRTRPRCAPSRQNLDSNESSPLLDSTYMRRDKKKNRQAAATSRRGSTRTRERRNPVQYKRTKPRKNHASRSENLVDDSCLTKGKKRTRGKIPRCESASSNSSSMRSPSLESVAPEQFLLLYCEPESDTFTKNALITGENFTNQESSNSEVDKIVCCRACGLQIEENKKGNQTLANAQQEQPVRSVQVTQNNVEKRTAVRDVEPETLIPAESEQPLETNEEAQLSRESLYELPEELEPETSFRVLLVQQDIEEFVDAVGVDFEAGGDGIHNIDQRAVQIILDAGLRDLVEMETSSDELETPNGSDSDFLNSQNSSGEEHQPFVDFDDDDGEYVQRPMDEDAEQNAGDQAN